MDESKIKNLQNEIKELKKAKAKFEKIAEKAAKKYGSKEAGKRVAGAAMYKNLTKKK